eukprot:1897615-Lingulodinium_polyedra.AAC.1
MVFAYAFPVTKADKLAWSCSQKRLPVGSKTILRFGMSTLKPSCAWMKRSTGPPAKTEATKALRASLLFRARRFITRESQPCAGKGTGWKGRTAAAR